MDGLPETVDEAVRQLEDAGLLGEVIAVLDENDLAGDALLRGSGASPGPAEVSVDVGQGIPGRYLVLVTSIDRERPIRVRLDAA